MRGAKLEKRWRCLFNSFHCHCYGPLPLRHALPAVLLPPLPFLTSRVSFRFARCSFDQSDFVIAASFDSWRGENRFERTYVEGVPEDADDEDSSSRRLSSSSYSGIGSTFSSSRVSMPSKSSKFTVEMIVGTGRYDGTNNEISMQLVGTDGTKTSHMPLGTKFKKGEVRSVTIEALAEGAWSNCEEDRSVHTTTRQKVSRRAYLRPLLPNLELVGGCGGLVGGSLCVHLS